MGGKTFFIINIGSFPLNGSVAIFLLPLIYTINDVITEVYGSKRTRSIVISGLFIVMLLLIFSLLAIHLPPSKRFLSTEKSYDLIFGTSVRIAFASLTAFAIAEFMDIFIFVKIRKRFGKKSLWFRNNISNFVSQFADTAIFMTLAFYAINKPFEDNLIFLMSLVIPYWLLKCFLSIIETPLVYIGVQWLEEKKNSVSRYSISAN